MEPEERVGADELDEAEEAVDLEVAEEDDEGMESTWEWDGSSWHRID